MRGRALTELEEACGVIFAGCVLEEVAVHWTIDVHSENRKESAGQ